MNPHRKSVLVAVVILAAVAAEGWFLLTTHGGKPTAGSGPATIANQSRSTRAAERVTLPPHAASVGSPAATAKVQLAENRQRDAGTARMIAAYRSLYAPAVANPDSIQNREILRTMVTKALANAAARPTPARVPEKTASQPHS